MRMLSKKVDMVFLKGTAYRYGEKTEMESGAGSHKDRNQGVLGKRP